MKLLSVESSARSVSVSLTDEDALMAQYYQNTGLTHSRTLLTMADDMLKNLELTPEDIDAFSVAIGPGSFTGVRIGVSAVKGMALALNRPCYGVSTLEAMAFNACHMQGTICCVMDARRSQVYNAIFAARDGKMTRLTEDRAISIDRLCQETGDKELLLVGDGAQLCYNWFKEAGKSALLLPENIRYQSAWGVAMAAKYAEPSSAHDLAVNYIRAPQAERQRLERQDTILKERNGY